ncbi:prophage CP4-57 regulatory [Caballeronia udeis]|uniref:Prophage CP4-57 regulatory n=1 Tax=Caballeronia udeis TaxID=1232866 RepID=A0A158IXV0_9BURK|nr:AlpA family phage regulatory protein [Caballeronia udeis]SAL60861.1 prophage CP4-57 regulatory [Caballeronia udeis]
MESSAVAAIAVHLRPAPRKRDSLPQDGFSRWSELRRFIPLSRETVRLREIAGRFPKRVHLTERCTAWSNAEIHKWLADPVGYRAGSGNA